MPYVICVYKTELLHSCIGKPRVNWAYWSPASWYWLSRIAGIGLSEAANPERASWYRPEAAEWEILSKLSYVVCGSWFPQKIILIDYFFSFCLIKGNYYINMIILYQLNRLTNLLIKSVYSASSGMCVQPLDVTHQYLSISNISSTETSTIMYILVTIYLTNPVILS